MVKTWRALILAALLALVPAAALATGQTSQTPGITISPAIVQLTMEPNQPGMSYDLTLTNHSPTTQNLQLSTIDFGTLDETGGLLLIGQPNDFSRQHGLASWMSLSQPTLSLAPGQTAKETVSVTNQDSLAPGGHYGAVLINGADQTAASGTQSQLTFKPVITQLLFFNKNGGDIFRLNLKSADIPHGWGGLPAAVTLRFQNTGNVHVVPRGIATVFDPAGREVARGVINDGSSILLPDSTRQFPVTLTPEAGVLLPGHYTLVVNWRYDGHDGFSRSEFAFTLIDLPLIIGWAIGLIILVAALWWMVRYLRRHPAARQRIKRFLRQALLIIMGILRLLWRAIRAVVRRLLSRLRPAAKK